MTSPRTFSLEKLRAEHASGTTAPKKNPTKLPLDELTTEAGAFQMREDELVESWAHDLHQQIKQGDGKLDPILVWWTGARWVVMDGHHRLEAYRRDRGRSAKYRRIPVTASQAPDVEAAILEANRENAKDKLNTTPEDKHRQAWFLTVEGIGGSVRDVQEATGTSKSTVDRMRQVLKALRGKGWINEYLLSLTWQEAREAAKDNGERVMLNLSEDEELEREAKRWAERLGREFGSKLSDAPDIAALMLLSYGRETTKRILQSRFLYELREELEEEESLEAEEDGWIEEPADRRIPLKDTSDVPF
ncbi:hypothetical protein JANAI62_35490 [Jannaschia pagri]|uniref:ParB-like nuclease domain-containing protein n=1 Tax=Jannaschia pagri TaxID=2829797 RepID=A0ABQ4NRA9_9RHOB|nr:MULTISPECIES: ParB N-terminal domain-containing protein [unclassified Jannaschia]GIT93167.1 hypothetical protein JANAI61_36250 [Jannaschia sp. AI_61]GIT96926.1 hypothetical protein JANAI62_35490 [Jannaschia sp. AI_62]